VNTHSHNDAASHNANWKSGASSEKQSDLEPLLLGSVLSPGSVRKTKGSSNMKKRIIIAVVAMSFIVMAGAFVYLLFAYNQLSNSQSNVTYSTSAAAGDSTSYINYNSGSKAVLPSIPDRALVLARRKLPLDSCHPIFCI
jgi:hypothetical protein